MNIKQNQRAYQLVRKEIDRHAPGQEVEIKPMARALGYNPATIRDALRSILASESGVVQRIDRYTWARAGSRFVSAEEINRGIEELVDKARECDHSRFLEMVKTREEPDGSIKMLLRDSQGKLFSAKELESWD